MGLPAKEVSGGRSTADAGRKRLAFALFAVGVPALGALLRAYGQANVVGGYRWTWLLFDWALLVGSAAFALGCNWAMRRAIERWARPKRKPARVALAAGRMAVLVLVPGTFALAALQLYPSHVLPWAKPSAYRLPYEDVTIESEGLRVVGWFIPGGDEDAPAVVIAHGIGGSRSDGLAGALVAHRIGFASLLLDHPGHGESDGLGATFGAREGRALKAAHDWLKARKPARPVHAIGYSMGGAAVLRAAAEYGIFERVAVDSTFGRLERVAKDTRLFVFGPARGLVWSLVRCWALLLTGNDYSSAAPEEDVARLGRPLLVIHGTADGTVPVSEVEHLVAAAGGKAQVFLVEGAGHMRTIGHPEYSKRVGAFLAGQP